MKKKECFGKNYIYGKIKFHAAGYIFITDARERENVIVVDQ